MPSIKSMARLYDSDVRVCTVIGFPLGANSIEAKAVEPPRVFRGW